MNARIALVLLSCLLSIATGLVLSRGKGDSTAKKNDSLVVGLSMDTLKEERWIGDRDLFVAKARELGAEVLVESANSDDTRQLRDVESLITRGVDALVIIPHNGAAMARAVEMAHAEGIPVLSYDRLITGADTDLYITFDNVKVGELQAQFISDRLPPQGKLRLIRIYGAKTDNNAVLFKQGQDNILNPLIQSGRIEVVFEDWAEDWKPENAKKITNAAITKAGQGIDAILASNDGTAGGAIQALIEEGLAGKVIVTGQDADLAGCQRIVAGTQTMTVYKPLSVLAKQAADLAVKLASRRPIIAKEESDNGKVKVPSVFLPIHSVTKENLRETVVKDGFRSAKDVYGE
ncbi:sugar ABC transporter substrate-binding protein [Prosthecobacter dejongeii]|uniref:D-xylose transport system substrate-binding protein n=1 Tax=Prosthecobacter dejongeii TaxID=48465 RepID=A0A7W7YNA6_9BACT|nr:substrate-binding domain-containing protein [Prosthecobacter dejongeii]MBB5039224.1 D-xylose transport system substrate-binding protein [Prosthecobacter dejongeii]